MVKALNSLGWEEPTWHLGGGSGRQSPPRTPSGHEPRSTEPRCRPFFRPHLTPSVASPAWVSRDCFSVGDTDQAVHVAQAPGQASTSLLTFN